MTCVAEPSSAQPAGRRKPCAAGRDRVQRLRHGVLSAFRPSRDSNALVSSARTNGLVRQLLSEGGWRRASRRQEEHEHEDRIERDQGGYWVDRRSSPAIRAVARRGSPPRRTGESRAAVGSSRDVHGRRHSDLDDTPAGRRRVRGSQAGLGRLSCEGRRLRRPRDSTELVRIC